MGIEDLPGEFVTFERNEIAEQYRRDYRIRNPGALTGPGTQPDLDARLVADAIVPLYSDATLIGNGIDEDAAVGEKLDRIAERLGLTRAPAVGASGFVTIPDGAPGGTIFSGDEIVEPNSGLRYECTATAPYGALDQVPVRGIDTGPDTNQVPTVVMQWTSPRPGIPPNATVFADAEGNGLTGGANEEDDEQLRSRIRERKANPPAGGNDAQVQDVVENTPGVAVEKAFTYPAILGPGTTGVIFTLRPGKPGADRIPNAAQIALVKTNAEDRLPADFSVLLSTLVAVDQDVVLKVTFETTAQGFVDDPTWPPYLAPSAGPGAIQVLSAASPESFTLETDDGVYTGVDDPVIGQTIAFFDNTVTTAPRFAKKKIKSFTGSGPWAIVVDTAAEVSDRTYTPLVGQRAMPWSPSLDSLLTPVRRFFDSLGPGEMVASFLGPGRRQRRFPVSPKSFPSLITNDLICRPGDDEPSLIDLEGVADALIEEGLGDTAPVGVAGVSANILQLKNVSVFPIT